MNCPRCNSSLPENANFCLECGANTSSSGQEEVEPEKSLGDFRTMASAAGAGGGRQLSGGELSIGDMRTIQSSGAARAEETRLSRGIPLSDRYEVLEEIGRGGFASVWKARDKKLDRLVAVKRLRSKAPGGADGARELERFRREAQVIAQLNHRNIVVVYDHDKDAEGDYIVMEYVDGGTLRDYLQQRGGVLPVEEAVALVRGIVQGLDHAHRKNLIHRDIKPANILLEKSREGSASSGQTPTPKIVDFGLARTGIDTGVSLSGYGMGTPAYMPPEQRRDAKSVNHTADFYAVGKTLYQLVSGDEPDNVDPERIPKVAGLAEVIFKCIKSNPEERYFSAESLLAALSDIIGKRGQAQSVRVQGTNVCAACGVANEAGVKFCVQCGAGLTRLCPECGRENSVHTQFCGACGTDVAGYLGAQETLARIAMYANDFKWSRVLKEAESLGSETRFPGTKGQAILSQTAQFADEARKVINESERLEKEIDALWKLCQTQAQAISWSDVGMDSLEQTITLCDRISACMNEYAAYKPLEEDFAKIKMSVERICNNANRLRVEKIGEIQQKQLQTIKKRLAMIIAGVMCFALVGIAVDQVVLTFRRDAFRSAVDNRNLKDALAIAKKLGTRYNTAGHIELVRKVLQSQTEFESKVAGKEKLFDQFGGADWENVKQLVARARARGKPSSAIVDLEEASKIVDTLNPSIVALTQVVSGFDQQWQAVKEHVRKYKSELYDTIISRLDSAQRLRDPMAVEDAYRKLADLVKQAVEAAEVEQKKEAAMIVARADCERALQAVDQALAERHLAAEWQGVYENIKEARAAMTQVRSFERAERLYIQAKERAAFIARRLKEMEAARASLEHLLNELQPEAETLKRLASVQWDAAQKAIRQAETTAGSDEVVRCYETACDLLRECLTTADEQRKTQAGGD